MKNTVKILLCKINILESFAKFTGKHLCQSLLFNKACNIIKRETLEQAFSCELLDLFKNPFFTFFLLFDRSSRPEVFFRKGVLRNFAKFTGKRLCQSLFFNKVAGLRSATVFKKRLWHMCFPVNFAKFLRTLFFIEHLWWLLLF